MGVTHPIAGDTQLSQFSPLNQLDCASREELLRSSVIERLPPGRCLFQREEETTRTLFLMAGQLALLSNGQDTRMLRADTREASTAIDPHSPHRVTALARTSVTILSIDSELLTRLLERSREAPTADETSRHAPAADNETLDAKLFASPLFSRLPWPHRQVLKNRMTRLRIPAGNILAREGDPARHYYFIEEGRLRLTRRSSQRRRDILFMEPGPGEGIGEYGLIASGRYDATATALKDTRVACVSKGEFLTLLVRPLLKWIAYSDIAPEQVHDSVLLDVRPVRSFQRSRLPGSVNLPLRLMRQLARLLDRGHDYIIYSDKSGDGASAAFLLSCHGIESRLLSDAGRPEGRNNSGTGPRGFRPLHA
ncbi:MAG: cyclic nucleotide-binding domain-containing protein [Nitrospiraceae bacterium]